MLSYHEGFGSGEKRMRVWISALVVLAATLTIAATSEAGENWPAWRGPHRDGVSAERNLPLRWDTEENITWKLALPEWSASTPIIWGDKIFLNVADGRTFSSGASIETPACPSGRSTSATATTESGKRICRPPRR